MRLYILFIPLALAFITKYSFGQSSASFSKKTLIPYADSVRVYQRATFTLQKDDYVKNLSFFCRHEWKLEKALRVPLRFRVGSLEQCNRLEGK